MNAPQVSLPWSGLAAKALVCSRDGYGDRALEAVNAIAVRFGQKTIVWAMCAWIDTVAQQLGIDDSQPLALAWKNADTREITGADSTPPEAVWAGRVAAARIANDEDTFVALINAVPTDEQWRANVSALLETCGLMLRRGSAS